ncbi:MAG TPA: LamG domain-containing protein [Candidatus Pacearchaeota archaeon]|nr:LamG domain-containing protein [Candidatus Parcubacteria bacterium]HOC53408.1 LamG domain-containing protein [Candidatus Pacearchaeota archaeon]HQM24344.1 LamG domain-containing protein [Candidatus Pacearchaeota archaeon]
MNKSFTLIEILVVIVVIGTLSAFILVGIGSINNSADMTKGKAFSNSLRNSLLMNLVGEWKFDEGSGQNLSDSWGPNAAFLGNNDTVEATDPAWVSSECVSENCLSFDGIDDTVNCGNNSVFDITGSVTLEGWAKYKSDAASYKGSIVGQPIAYILNFDLGRTLYFNLRNSADTWFCATYSPVLSQDFLKKWHHYVGTWNKETGFRYLYIDGKLQNTPASCGTYDLKVTNDQVVIGNVWGNWPMPGFLDEIRVYKEFLSLSQVQENYYSGINKLFKNNLITQKEYKDLMVEN